MDSKKIWFTELAWWLFTVFAIVLIIWPIRQEIYGYPFEKSNILFIITAITLLRWLLFLPSTVFAKNQWIKAILIFFSIWLVIYSFNKFAFFQTFMDEKGVESLTNHLDETRQLALARYINSEFIFFAVTTIICGLLLPFRLIVSIWRTHNKNEV